MVGFVADFMFCLLGLVYFYVLRPEFPDFGNVPPHSLAAGRSEAHAAHHWMLLLSSVPFASDIFIFPMD